MLSQHIGAPCSALVAKRDKVQAGQMIGKSEAFVSAPVHSPVSGTVKDITLASHPVVGRSMAIVIDTDLEADNEKKPCPEKFTADFDVDAYSAEQIRDAIANAGIVGMGGAGFPTLVKIVPNPKQPKKIVIINACECEPFITCDYRIMLSWCYQIIAGIKLACKAAECDKVAIGIEDNKPEAIKAMTEAVAASKNTGSMEVLALKTQYPQGGEKQLIKAVTGMDIPVGQIPPMIGVAVFNISTCAAIAEAVVLGNALTHRVVTVSGGGIANPGNYYCPVGISVNDLIELCGGLTDKARKVLMGGPMMGFSIGDLSTPLTKTSGAITILTETEITKAKFENRETPCIRCGRCIDVCPANINPTKIAHAVRHDLFDVAERYHMSSCIECGCCSYICPANIELKGYINTGKVLVARAKRRMPK
jgi:electron transport complex protein RnfC